MPCVVGGKGRLEKNLGIYAILRIIADIMIFLFNFYQVVSLLCLIHKFPIILKAVTLIGPCRAFVIV